MMKLNVLLIEKGNVLKEVYNSDLEETAFYLNDTLVIEGDFESYANNFNGAFEDMFPEFNDSEEVLMYLKNWLDRKGVDYVYIFEEVEEEEDEEKSCDNCGTGFTDSEAILDERYCSIDCEEEAEFF